MNNNILLSLVVNIVSVFVISFVVLMIIYKSYVKIRSYFNATVNCWFCNENTRVPYTQSNSWICPFCEQYNGFSKNGDYNRVIYEQLDCSKTQHLNSNNKHFIYGTPTISHNGFCGACNEAQRLKIEKLANFEPKKETRYNEELKVFKKLLEEQYGLCGTCERHLNKVLREKRKMVLGSKFLDTIIKGAYNIKQPYLNHLRCAKLRQWKQRYRLSIIILSIVNVICLYESSPTLTREHITYIMGAKYGVYVFRIVSHILALLRVLHSYWRTLCDAEILIKFGLFTRTLYFMIMYSLGLRITHMNLSSVFCSIYPFSVLILSFAHQLIDGFHLTTYTFLMTVWSILASGLWDFHQSLNTSYFLSFMSLLTVLLMFTTKPTSSPKLHDNSQNSFHKLYSEDFLSDDEDEINDGISYNGVYGSTSDKSLNFAFPSTPFTRLRRQPTPGNLINSHNCNGIGKSITTTLPYEQQNLRTSLSLNNTPLMYYKSAIGHSDYNTCTTISSQSVLNLNNGLAQNGTIAQSEYVQPNLLCPQIGNTFCTTHRCTNTFGGGKLKSHNFANINKPTSTQSPFSLYDRMTSTPEDIFQNRKNQLPRVTSNGGYNWAMKSISSPSNISWVSGGYFNQAQSVFLQPTRFNINNNTNNTSENISRASSRSSGFESQNDFVNASRENSSCRDIDCQQQRTVTVANSKGFENNVLNERNGGVKSSLLRCSQFNLNNSVNKACDTATGMILDNQQSFIPLQTVNRKAEADDIFNLHQINDQLLTIKPSENRIL